MNARNKTIRVDVLSRVEGEGALYVKVRGNQLKEVQFKIFEPPRFFEAFLRGRNYKEAPDITARICGICPVAYQMSAVQAMEDALQIDVSPQVRDLRRLLYCGEWIESHALHIYMLHAPDFLGYPDAIHMAKDHPDEVRRGLELKKTGNEIVRLLGGREIHPVNVRIGGFYRAPSKRELQSLRDPLLRATEIASETVKWTSRFPFPQFEQDYQFVALRHRDEYAIHEGQLVSNRGLAIQPSEYEKHFSEEHVEHSNALHSTLRGEPYFVGPLARYSLNFDRLTPLAQDAAISAGLSNECKNPFQSIVVRAIEVLYACDEAIRLIDRYEMPEAPFLDTEPRLAMGFGCTEAPRGILYHRYKIDERGNILDAKIVPPTSQNQKQIEKDLWDFVPPRLELPHDQLTLQCEQAIRNYDPCISCATHFLQLEVDRE